MDFSQSVDDKEEVPMRWNRWIGAIVLAGVLFVAGRSTAYSRQSESPEAATSIIQYKTVAMTNSETQQQVQVP
jgi:hypothetical protein